MPFEDRLVWVENDDTSITYVGEWTTVQASVVNVKGFGTLGPAISATLHSTTAISSFVFPFHGSSIRVLGSINITDSSTDPDPTWQCALDGISLGAPNIFGSPENDWALCSETNIPDDAHELVVNVTSKGMPFYLDYIEYRPSASVSLENKVILIDNVDPAIEYSSGWEISGRDANQTTDPVGLVNLTFVGIQLSWYGIIPSNESHNASSGEYSIDGQPFTFFQLLGLPPGSDSTEYTQLFFMTPGLEMGMHRLSAKYTGSPGQTPLTLDYLLVTNGSFPSTTNSSSPKSVPSSNGGTGGSPPSIPTNDNSNSKASSNVGAIVGGVVGGIGGLAICSIILFIWLKSQRKWREDERNYDRTRHSVIEPYSIPSQVTDISQSASLLTTASEMSKSGGTSTATSRTTTASRTTATRSQTASSRRHHPSQPNISQSSGMLDLPSSSNNQTFPPAVDNVRGRVASASSRRPLPATPPMQVIEPTPENGSVSVPETNVNARGHIQHEDSGIRLPPLANGQVVEIPPIYSEQ